MRAFLFTLDASICLLLLMAFAAALMPQKSMDLNDEMLAMLVQDAIEVCSIEMRGDNECVIELIGKANPGIRFNGDCDDGIAFRRRYHLAEGISLKAC